ncbi:PAS domain S-box protein [Microcoleus sp.]|uniref:PAS domain S-box protein n=1 Tax=Microcoleus sp. TaxID=44472 RepID=UPI0035254732
MQLKDLPTLERAIDRHPITVAPQTSLLDVLRLMGQVDGEDSFWFPQATVIESGDEPESNQRMSLLHNGCVLVVEESSNHRTTSLAGIFTARDAMCLAASGITCLSPIKIADVMRQPQVVFKLSEAQDIFTPLLIFRQHQISYLPIVDDRDRLLGIVTPESILENLQSANLLKLGTVAEVMKTQILSVPRHTSVLKTAQLMVENLASWALITDNLREGVEYEVAEISRIIPAGIVTEHKILQAQALGIDLAQTHASAIMRRLGTHLNPEDSLWRACQQMQQEQMQPLLVSHFRENVHDTLLGIVAQVDLLGLLEPAQIYKGLKRAQQSIRQLQIENTELLRSRNAELETQVEQRTAELQAALTKVEQQAKQAALINQIVQVMRDTMVVDKILQTTVDQLHESLNVSRCLILEENSSEEIYITYFSEATPEAEQLLGMRCPILNNYKQQLIDSHQVAFGKIDDSLTPELQAVAHQFSVHAMLITPLLYQQQFLGAICLHQCDREREWTDSELEFVKTISTHCAIAIHQAKLYQQLQTELAERERAEAALQSQKEFLRNVIDTSPHAIFVKDCNGTYVLVNQFIAELLGTTVENLTGKKDAEFIDDHAQVERFLADVREITSTLEPKFFLEETITTPTGEIRYFQIVKKPLLSADGTSCQILGVATDITDRKLAEQALRESEQLFRLMADTAPVFIWMSGTDSRRNFFNQGWLDFTGRTLEQQLDNSWTTAVHPDDLHQCLDIYLSSFNTSQKFLMEYRLRNADGEFRWILDRGVPRFTPSGDFAGYIGSCVDITERKVAEESLQQAKEQLQAVLDAVPGFISWIDADGKYLGVNRHLADSFNLMPKDFIGKELGFMQNSPLFTEFMIQFIGSSNVEASQVIESQIDGRTRYYLLAAHKYQQETAAVCVGIDITERKQAEESLRESQIKLSAIFNNTFQFTGLLQLDGTVVEANQTVLDFGGLQLADVVGLPLWETRWWTISTATQERLKSAIAYAASGNFIRYEVDVWGVGNTIATIDFSIKPMKDEAGEVVMLIAEGRDITELKQAQNDRDRFFNNSMDLMAIAEFNGCFKLVNPACTEILGYTKNQLEGQNFIEFIHPDDLQTVHHVWAQEKNTGHAVRDLEIRYRCLNGTYKWLSWNSIPFPEEGISYGFARDITARKAAEKAWELLNEELENKVEERTAQLRTANQQLHQEIRERQQFEAALRASQEQLQAILDNSPAVIYVVDIQNRYILVNHKFENLFGVTTKQLIGQSIYTQFSQKIADYFAEKNRLVIESEQPIKSEETIRLKDGIHTYITIKFPLKDAQGVTYAVCGISTDITDRQIAEETLRRQLAAVEAATDGIAILNAQGEYIYLNASHNQIFGYDSSSSLLGKTWRELYSQEEIERFDREIFPLFSQTGKWQGEAIGKRRDGTKIAQEISLTLIEEGGIICVCRDISQRKVAEETSRIRDRAITASSNGIIISDARLPDNPLIYVNPAFERITGYSAAEAIGRNCRFLQGTETNQPGLDQLSTAIKEQKNCVVILRNYRKDGTMFWNELSISPIYDAQENLTHYIGIQTDITDRKLAEKALWATQDRLKYLLSCSPAVIYSTKSAGDYCPTFISENITSLVGYEAREFLADSSFWNRHIHPEDAPRVSVNLQSLIEQGSNIQEYRFLHQDGTYRWLYNQTKLVRDVEGKPREIVGYLADISDRKQAESERSRLVAILEASTDFVGMSDIKGNVLWNNNQMKQLMGIPTNQELLQSDIPQYHPQWALEIIQNQGLPSATHNGVWVGETALLRKDGTEMPVSQMIIAHKSPTDTVEFYSTLMRDITALKQAETALQQAKDQLQAVLDAVPGSVSWISSELRYLGVNQHLAATFNLAPDAFVGQDIGFLKNSANFAEFMRQFMILPGSATSQIIDFKIDDSTRNYLVVAQKYQQGAAAVSVGIDITDRKLAESKLLASLKDKEVLLKEIHHRVKNNLQIISSLLKLQSGYIKDREALTMFIDSYNRVRSMALIHEKLYQSQTLAKIDAADYIRNLTANLFQSYTVTDTQIQLHVEIDRIELDIDTAIPCGLIVNELVSNCLKYAFLGKINGHIHIKFVYHHSPEFLLMVRDDGVGLPSDFNIEESDSLGLQLVSNLSEQLGGELQIFSEAGTCFQITFDLPKPRN